MAANDLVKLGKGNTPTAITGAPGLDVWETLARTNPGRPGWLRDRNNQPVQMATPEGAAAAADLVFDGLETAGKYGAVLARYREAAAAKPSLLQDPTFKNAYTNAKVLAAQAVTIVIGGLIFLSDIATVIPVDVNITTPHMRSKGRVAPLGKNFNLGSLGTVVIAVPADWRALATRLQQGVAKLQDRPIEGEIKIAARLSEQNMRGMGAWSASEILLTSLAIVVVAAAVYLTGGLAIAAGLSLMQTIATVGAVGLVVGGTAFALIAAKYSSELYSQKLTADGARLDKSVDNELAIVNKMANEPDPAKRAAMAEALDKNRQIIEDQFKAPDIDPFGLKGMMGGAKTFAYVIGGVAAIGALTSLVKTFKSKE